jgi:hypothetical protein
VNTDGIVEAVIVQRKTIPDVCGYLDSWTVFEIRVDPPWLSRVATSPVESADRDRGGVHSTPNL